MAVRVSTLGLSLFRLGGRTASGQQEVVELNKHWQSIDATAHPKVIAGLRDYHARFVQVHPEDRTKLGELGLAFVDEHSPLVAAPKKTKTDGKAAGEKTEKTEPKTDGKAAGEKD